MFLVLLVLTIFAVVGATAWFNGETATPAPDPTAVVTVTPLMVATWVTDTATKFYYSSSGLEVRPLPTTGCSRSLLDPVAVQELLAVLPEPQATTLASLLGATQSAWMAQAYSGVYGTGLCLPVQGKLVVLPPQ